MKNRFAALAGFLFAAASTVSLASADDYKLDPVHSMVVFQISHMGVSNPYGVFHALSGTISTVGSDNLPKLDLTLPVEKLNMGTDAWEKHIKSADFFNAKQFPNITFKSGIATKTAENTYEVSGDLTLHGVTKPMTLTLTKTGEAKGMKGETLVGYSAMFKVKRSDFDVKYLVGPVGDEVTLMVNIEAQKQ